METLYRSCDGILYDNRDKCLQHEKEVKDFIMLDKKGNKVYKPDEAYFIICPTDGNAKRLFNYFIKDFEHYLPWEEEEEAQKGIYFDVYGTDWKTVDPKTIENIYEAIKTSSL